MVRNLKVVLLYDVKHWLDRADECDILASEMQDKICKALWVTIAEGHRRMAEQSMRWCERDGVEF